MKFRIFGILPLLIAALVAVQGCEDTKPSPAVESAIRETVTDYLNALAQAYSSLSVEPIENIATAREIADVRKILRQLLSTGDRLDAKLLSVDFEAISVFRSLNATVSTTEVWDVSRYDSGTGVEKGRNPASVQKSVLQLRLIDGKWRVVARRVMETQGGSKWKMPEKGAPGPKADTKEESSGSGGAQADEDGVSS